MIIGANGQLGNDLVKVLRPKHELIALTHKDIEICEHQSIIENFKKYRPSLLLNMSAFHKVEVCEEQILKSFNVNAYAVRDLALVCRDYRTIFVHMSTDYVFGGDPNRNIPYKENDLPLPVNVYGVSKLSGECFIRYILDRYFIIRVSGLYGIAGSSGKGGNFVETMLRLARERKPIRVVSDQYLTPTYTFDLARQIKELIETDYYGLYHSTSEGSCNWYEFAAEIFRISGLGPDLSKAKTGDFGEKVRRPAYSVLENVALKKIGINSMRPWRESLAAYLEERKQYYK